MYIQILLKVFIVFSVLVWACHGQDNKVDDVQCDTSVDDSSTLTLNCSRRDLDIIPKTWPREIDEVSDDGHVLVTFFSNNIRNITQLDSIPGSRVAISFKANRVEDIVDDAFRNIKQLVYLDLSNNSITGQVLRSEVFQGPYESGKYDSIALETLNLGYNRIHSIDRYLFQYTPNLTRLYLDNNPIEILDHVTILAISSAQNLEVLDMASTDIDTIPLDAFKALTKLQQIDLSGNKFTVVPDSLRMVGATLEYLSFNNNPIVELNDDSFMGLSNLKELEVAQNSELLEVKRSTFTPLTSLRILHLCHNPNLRYISHNAFRTLKSRWTLKEVYLDDNNLSELSTDLMPWSKVETLGMTGNNWLCNCDLANIVTKQGAGKRFKEIPYCMAPIRLSGEFITNISTENCPTYDTTFASRKSILTDIKPKHILWSILGVAAFVLIGMGIGLLVNVIKVYVRNKFNDQSIRYVNISHSTSSFA